MSVTVGFDEAGRGAFWGPVACACVALPSNIERPHFLRDSKKLSPKRRTEMRAWVEAHASAWAVELVGVEDIQRLNIRTATFLGWQRAWARVQDTLAASSLTISSLVVDGDAWERADDGLPFPEHFACEPRADDTHASVAAASIMAKTTRDEWVDAMVAAEWEDGSDPYDLCRSKGYGTKQHRDALGQLGMHALHRTKFCRNWTKAE